MQSDQVTEFTGRVPNQQVQRKFSMQNTANNGAGKMLTQQVDGPHEMVSGLQEPFIGKISFNQPHDSMSNPQVVFELEDPKQRLYKTQSGPRFRPQIGQFNYQRLNSKHTFPQGKNVNSQLFSTKQKQQKIYQLITKVRPQRQSSHKAGSQTFHKLNNGISSGGYNMTPSNTQRPYTSGNVGKIGQPGFNEQSKVTIGTANFKSNPSSPKRGKGNFQIIHKNDPRFASGTVSLKDQKTLCVVAKNPVMANGEQTQQSTFYLSQHALSARNNKHQYNPTIHQAQQALSQDSLGEKTSLCDISQATDAVYVKMDKLGGKRIVFSPKFHEKVRDSLQSNIKDPGNYNPVIVPRAQRKHKDLGQNFAKSCLARNLNHIDKHVEPTETSYQTNDIRVIHAGNKNYIQVLENEQVMNESYRGLQTQTKMMGDASRADFTKSRQSRFSSTQPCAGLRMSNPAMKFNGGGRSPTFSPIPQEPAYDPDDELQLQGTQANLKRRYTCSTDNLRRSNEYRNRTVTQATYPVYHQQSLAETCHGSHVEELGQSDEQNESVDITINPTVYSPAGQRSKRIFANNAGQQALPQQHHHAVPTATYNTHVIDYNNLQKRTQMASERGSGAEQDSSGKQSQMIPPVLLPLQEVMKQVKNGQRNIMNKESSRSYLPESQFRPGHNNKDLPENDK